MSDNFISKYTQVLSLVNVNFFWSYVMKNWEAVIDTPNKPLWSKWPTKYTELFFIRLSKGRKHTLKHARLCYQVIHSESALIYQMRPKAEFHKYIYRPQTKFGAR